MSENEACVSFPKSTYKRWQERLRDIAEPSVKFDPNIAIMQADVLREIRAVAREMYNEIEDSLVIPNERIHI